MASLTTCTGNHHKLQLLTTRRRRRRCADLEGALEIPEAPTVRGRERAHGEQVAVRCVHTHIESGRRRRRCHTQVDTAPRLLRVADVDVGEAQHAPGREGHPEAVPAALCLQIYLAFVIVAA